MPRNGKYPEELRDCAVRVPPVRVLATRGKTESVTSAASNPTTALAKVTVYKTGPVATVVGCPASASSVTEISAA